MTRWRRKKTRKTERQAELVRLILKTGSLLGGLHPAAARTLVVG